MINYDKIKHKINETHDMGKAFPETRVPAGTPRFYSVRQCKLCEAEIIEHPAGSFIDRDLLQECLCKDD